jgi:hypothetical protein
MRFLKRSHQGFCHIIGITRVCLEMRHAQLAIWLGKLMVSHKTSGCPMLRQPETTPNKRQLLSCVFPKIGQNVKNPKNHEIPPFHEQTGRNRGPSFGTWSRKQGVGDPESCLRFWKLCFPDISMYKHFQLQKDIHQPFKNSPPIKNNKWFPI